MMERPLKTADELKALPFGHFILMKTGVHPMETKLNLYPKWGIDLDTPYIVPERPAGKVEYADRLELMEAIRKKHPSAPVQAPAPAPPSADGKKRVRT